MKNFNNSLTKWRQDRRQAFPHHLFILLLLLAFIGMTDAAYLTAAHYTGIAPDCTLLKGCEQVTTSRYAMIGILPVALLGVVYYVTVLFMTVFVWEGQRAHLFGRLIALSSAGLIGSAYFVYLQLFIIHALCMYCLISAFDTFFFWLIAAQLLSYTRATPESP